MVVAQQLFYKRAAYDSQAAGDEDFHEDLLFGRKLYITPNHDLALPDRAPQSSSLQESLAFELE
jgi:hypothetical protein